MSYNWQTDSRDGFKRWLLPTLLGSVEDGDGLLRRLSDASDEAFVAATERDADPILRARYATAMQVVNARDSLIEQLNSVKRMIDWELDSIERKGLDYSPSSLGIFQSNTTIADAKSASLSQALDALKAVASAQASTHQKAAE